MTSVAFLILLIAAAAAPVAVPRNATLPVVSPDGRHIAYVSERAKNAIVWITDVEGNDRYPVSPTALSARSPSWSADSRTVTYTTSSGDTLRLWSLEIPSREGREIWTPSRRMVFRAVAKSARLSNDGRRVAYARGDWTRNRLVVASVDGSGETAITDSSAGYFNMAWSPDDRQIAVTRVDPKRDMQVWVMNADGSEARALTHFAKEDGSPQWPAWSPDGKTIAIQSNLHGQPGSAWIWLVDVATGKATNVTPHTDPRLDETPSWFPDGKRLAFQSDRSGSMEVWTMGADGSDAKQLTR